MSGATPANQLGPPRAKMPDREDITIEMLAEHWAKQVRRLLQPGVRMDAIASSLRTAALQAESDWFVSVVEELRDETQGPEGVVTTSERAR